MRQALESPRCRHIKLNGQPCGCPARHGKRLCHFHEDMRLQRNFEVPILEDAASIQLALMRMMRALQQKTYDTKTCALMLYALQIASSNLRRLADDMPSAGDESEHPALALLRELDVLPRDAEADPQEPAAVAGERKRPASSA